MEFKEAMRIWKRMCKSARGCDHCDAQDACETCAGNLNSAELESILAKWAQEHPERTIMDDFFTKHPKAPRRSPDYPEACARVVGYISECPATVNNCVGCNDCWRRPLEEE